MYYVSLNVVLFLVNKFKVLLFDVGFEKNKYLNVYCYFIVIL